MKEIEKITVKELEAIASGEEIEVPSGLESSIVELADSLEAVRKIERENRKIPLKRIGAAASVAILIAAGITAVYSREGLKDTFDDPVLAYAEAEKALMMISEAMKAGAMKTDEAIATFERQEELLENIIR